MKFIPPENIKNDTTHKEYFGLNVIVWRMIYHPYPWRFGIEDKKGITHVYGGVPNYCTSKRSALKRAWYRAKWMNNSTYSNKYK